MKQYLFTLLLMLLIFSCTHITQTKQELCSTINQTLHIAMFDTVRQGNDLLRYADFRKQYPYLSVVYLQNGCSPCYSKYINWQNKMDSLSAAHNHSVLFVIKGHSYEEFMQSVLDVDSVIDKYYTIMDADGEFLKRNDNIPRWMIDASLLIDAESKIKMVGAPFATPQMTELFRKICSQ